MIVPLIGEIQRAAWVWVDAQLDRYPMAYTKDDVKQMAENGHLTVWAVFLPDSNGPVALVLLAKHEDGSGQIVYGAGERMGECIDEVIDTARQWCGWNACNSLRVEGRKGWGRQLKRYGFLKEGDAWVLPLAARP